jgi:hypothetical protein
MCSEEYGKTGSFAGLLCAGQDVRRKNLTVENSFIIITGSKREKEENDK